MFSFLGKKMENENFTGALGKFQLTKWIQNLTVNNCALDHNINSNLSTVRWIIIPSRSVKKNTRLSEKVASCVDQKLFSRLFEKVASLSEFRVHFRPLHLPLSTLEALHLFYLFYLSPHTPLPSLKTYDPFPTHPPF